jgi:hypothetical protein
MLKPHYDQVSNPRPIHLAAFLSHLDRGTFYRTVRAEHTTIPLQGFNNSFTTLTFVEEGTRIFRHGFFF